jgi:hypothetical protein
MIPGREVWMSIFSLLAARSISTLATPACWNRRLRSFLSDRSSCNKSAYSLSANQRDFQVLLNPIRNP